METLNCFSIIKSEIEFPLAREVILPIREEMEITRESAEFKFGLVLLNLTEFLQIQMLLKIEIIATIITT
jgi:hypothetical protein